MKSLTPRQRIVYLWDYYKLTIGAFVLAAALLIYTLGYQSGRGKVDMYAVLINAGEGDSTPFIRALEEKNLSSTVSVDVSLSYKNAVELRFLNGMRLRTVLRIWNFCFRRSCRGTTRTH